MEKHQFSAGKFAFGVVLLLVGGLRFLDELNVLNPRPIATYWPVLLIIIGAVCEFDAIRTRRGDGGIFVLAAGIWMLFGTQHLFGLSIRTALPIGVIVVGLGVILHAFIDVPRTQLKENNNHE